MPVALSTTTALQKPLRILRVLSDPGISRLTDIARAAGIDKASALRALQALMDEGFVRRDEATKRYGYGEEAYVLAAALQARQDVRSAARPALVRLAAATGDLVTLLVRSGLESVCVDREAGNFPLQLSQLDIGTRRPLGLGAGSLALVAWSDAGDVDTVLAGIEEAVALHPTISMALLREEARACRERGYVRLLDVVVPDVGAIARPVRGIDGRVCGAVSISGLTKRVMGREKQLADSLAQEIAAIEQRLSQPPR